MLKPSSTHSPWEIRVSDSFKLLSSKSKQEIKIKNFKTPTLGLSEPQPALCTATSFSLPCPRSPAAERPSRPWLGAPDLAGEHRSTQRAIASAAPACGSQRPERTGERVPEPAPAGEEGAAPGGQRSPSPLPASSPAGPTPPTARPAAQRATLRGVTPAPGWAAPGPGGVRGGAAARPSAGPALRQVGGAQSPGERRGGRTGQTRRHYLAPRSRDGPAATPPRPARLTPRRKCGARSG